MVAGRRDANSSRKWWRRCGERMGGKREGSDLQVNEILGEREKKNTKER
jgi:hypothetical protein